MNNRISNIAATPIPKIEKVDIGVAVKFAPILTSSVSIIVASIIFATNANITTNDKTIINGLSFLIATISIAFWRFEVRRSS